MGLDRQLIINLFIIKVTKSTVNTFIYFQDISKIVICSRPCLKCVNITNILQLQLQLHIGKEIEVKVQISVTLLSTVLISKLPTSSTSWIVEHISYLIYRPITGAMSLRISIWMGDHPRISRYNLRLLFPARPRLGEVVWVAGS